MKKKTKQIHIHAMIDDEVISTFTVDVRPTWYTLTHIADVLRAAGERFAAMAEETRPSKRRKRRKP